MDESRRHKSALYSVYQANLLQACARSRVAHRDRAIFLSLALPCQNRGPNRGADLKKPADVGAGSKPLDQQVAVRFVALRRNDLGAIVATVRQLSDGARNKASARHLKMLLIGTTVPGYGSSESRLLRDLALSWQRIEFKAIWQ